MLNQVLREIENTYGSISLGELSRKLGVESAALEGMIQFWVQKGRLKRNDNPANEASYSCGSGTNSCAPVSDCVFIANMPNAYSFSTKDRDKTKR